MAGAGLPTGSGKTWVMAMAIVWARFHKQRVQGSELSTNFLIVAPNVIVYQRLERDFAANRIFYELPLIPTEWRGEFSQKVILRGEATEPDASGILFLTNIRQLHESGEQKWTPVNAIEALLGNKLAKDLAASSQRSMLERVKSLKDLVVMNDEAHHVHDEELAWSQSLLALQRALPKGLSLWLDFSATPKGELTRRILNRQGRRVWANSLMTSDRGGEDGHSRNYRVVKHYSQGEKMLALSTNQDKHDTTGYSFGRPETWKLPGFQV